MQRRQLTNEEKRQVIQDQLRETWERSDGWIASDLGVNHKTVRAQRMKIIEVANGDLTELPEQVIGRDDSPSVVSTDEMERSQPPRTPLSSLASLWIMRDSPAARRNRPR